jgi:outer membrane protein OmpA-like peptidoglycan-associated protein
MADEMTHAENRQARRNLWRKLLGVGTILAVITAAATLLWYTLDRLKTVEERLGRSEERSQAVLRQMTEYSRELELALQRAREFRQRADESEALRTQAASRAERAQGEAEQARAESQAAREQTEQLRRRRDQELDRMQEALNRIAPTRRTPLGMVVEIASDSFRFDFDKSTLRPENRELLSRVAGVLLASSGYRLYVYGHTDDIGTDEYNQALSERRAHAVAEYLIEAGVPGDIVSTRGFGKSSPRVKAVTGNARERNRRVEIGIVDTIIKYQGVARERQP